jgi:Arc/MetJ-type ribon-helix-helix transcriptional regulator
MSPTQRRASRVFTISFPETLAQQVEEVAKRESRNISELFREAFRRYQLEGIQSKLLAARHAAAERKPQKNFTENDVEGLVDEIRTELPRRKKGKV